MIAVEQQDGLALMRMEHGKVNALDVELCEGLTAKLEELEADPAPAVVLTGHGNVFSAGVDLLRILEGGAPYVRRFLPAFHRFFEVLFSFPKPLVAAINGHAIAGGCVVACTADRRIMGRETGRVGIPELRVGVPFPAAPVEIIRFAVPARHFPDLIYGGALVETGEAVERGLVDEVVEPGRVLERSLAVAADLASMGAARFRLTKSQIRGPARERIRSEHQRTAAAVEEIWCDDATLAGIRDYVSRTFRRP
jgi:enoyl-CoA hydratase